MNKLKHQSKFKVEPSSRDSISSWLDVLTGMLVMPESQRTQVRDELEDHLRSRVDDLLIVGKSESEAIRIAVAELGETAELAKLITHAHTKSNPRRKIMNTALITVALAGMSFGGFSYINGTGAPSATPSNSGAVPVVVSEETKKNDEKTHTFAINQDSMMAILSEIAEAFDRDLEFSADSRKPQMDSFLGGHYGILEGEYTFDQVINRFKNDFPQGFYGYKLIIDGQAIQFMSENEYLRSIVETRVYATPVWIHTQTEQYNYAESLESLLGVKFDLSYTSVHIIGDSIVVAAQPNIHTAFIRLTNELHEVIGKRDATMKTKREQAKAEQVKRQVEAERIFMQETRERKSEQALAVEHIQTEFNAVRSKLFAINELMGVERMAIMGLNERMAILELNEQMAIMELNEQSLTQGDALNPDEKEKIQQARNDRSARYAELEYLHEENQARYIYLRDRLIDSQYAPLFEGLE